MGKAGLTADMRSTIVRMAEEGRKKRFAPLRALWHDQASAVDSLWRVTEE